MRKWMMASAGLAMMGTCGLASAQVSAPNFGAQGQLTISAERLFGIYYAKASRDYDNRPSEDLSSTVIGLGISSDPAISSFVQPRAGVDYFVADRLSLGGALGLYSASGDLVSNSGFLLAPRVGYAINLGEIASFWPRGGFTYYSHADHHNVGLTGEANFALFPRNNWGFLLTPFFDFGPFGGGPNTMTYSEFTLGISVGVMGII